MGVKIFISYAIKDGGKFDITNIYRNLQNLVEVDDVKLWKEDALANISDYMKTYVDNCDILTLFCSTNSFKSKPVIKEWKNALDKDKRVVPIFFDLKHVPQRLTEERGVKFEIFEDEQNIKDLNELIIKIAKDIDTLKDAVEFQKQKELEQNYAERIKNLEEQLKQIQTSMTNQREELAKEAPAPKVSHKIEFATDWSQQIDIENTRKYRKDMVENLLTKSNTQELLDDNVLKAMEVVPREIFVDWDIVKQIPNYRKEPKLPLAYNYEIAMPVAEKCNVSSPEIIASQLSLVKIKPNNKVLFIGAKGGYMESLAADIVGASGVIVIYSGDEDVLKRSFEVCVEDTPYAEIMKFMKAKDVFDINPIKKYGFFDVIFVCGVVPKIPSSFAYLLEDNGILLAPVGSKKHQQYTILEKSGGSLSKRVIRDFSVVFGPVR